MNKKIAARMDMLAPPGIHKVNEKALAMERAGEKILHFEIGRLDFDTSEYIKKICEKNLESGDVLHISNFGSVEPRIAIAEKFRRQNHIDYKPTEILVTVGPPEAAFNVPCSISDEGDEALVPDPVWINYMNVLRLLGAAPVTFDLNEETGFQIDLDEVHPKVTGKIKALVSISSNNPTGGVLPGETLRGLAEIAIENDLVVVADEVYERLAFDGECHIFIASPSGMKECTSTVNDFSKACSMTGWCLGYVATPEEYIVVLNKIHQHNTACVSSFVQTASIVALRDEADEVEKMVAEYSRRRDYAVRAINEIPDLSCQTPKGAFHIFINAKELDMSSVQLADYLLDHAKIAMVPGDVSGPDGEDYLRMFFANSYENIVEGCERLRKAAEELRG